MCQRWPHPPVSLSGHLKSAWRSSITERTPRRDFSGADLPQLREPTGKVNGTSHLYLISQFLSAMCILWIISCGYIESNSIWRSAEEYVSQHCRTQRIERITVCRLSSSSLTVHSFTDWSHISSATCIQTPNITAESRKSTRQTPSLHIDFQVSKFDFESWNQSAKNNDNEGADWDSSRADSKVGQVERQKSWRRD